MKVVLEGRVGWKINGVWISLGDLPLVCWRAGGEGEGGARELEGRVRVVLENWRGG